MRVLTHAYVLPFWFLDREHFECKVLVLNICICKGQSLFVFVKVVDHNGNGRLNIHERFAGLPEMLLVNVAIGSNCWQRRLWFLLFNNQHKNWPEKELFQWQFYFKRFSPIFLESTWIFMKNCLYQLSCHFIKVNLRSLFFFIKNMLMTMFRLQFWATFWINFILTVFLWFGGCWTCWFWWISPVIWFICPSAGCMRLQYISKGNAAISSSWSS